MSRTVRKLRAVARAEPPEPTIDRDETWDEPTIELDEEPKSRTTRGPGRPRKKVVSKTWARKGILSAPSNEHAEIPNTIELSYENPMLFRKIFALFKVYSIEQIRVTFAQDRVYFYSSNKENDVKLFVEIFCENMNEYYSAEQYHTTFNTEHFHKIFANVTKDHSQVMFATNQHAQYSKIWVAFVDEDNEESIYEVELSPPDPSALVHMHTIFAQEPSYPIEFDYGFRLLKRKMTEFANLGTKVTIRQTIEDGTGAREFAWECNETNEKIKNVSPIGDLERKNFVSTCNAKLLAAPVLIKSIRPLANTLIADHVRISVDDSRDMIFSMVLDHDIDATKSKIQKSEKCRIRVAMSLAKSQGNNF